MLGGISAVVCADCLKGVLIYAAIDAQPGVTNSPATYKIQYLFIEQEFCGNWKNSAVRNFQESISSLPA